MPWLLMNVILEADRFGTLSKPVYILSNPSLGSPLYYVFLNTVGTRYFGFLYRPSSKSCCPEAFRLNAASTLPALIRATWMAVRATLRE